MNDQPKDIAKILKGQLGMVALVVLLSGTVYADTYYSRFGLKLSSMGFSTSYIIYRGITAVIASHAVAIPYLLSVVWLVIDDLYLRSREGWHWFRIPAAYLLVVLVLASSYFLSYRAGLKKTNDDMHTETSSLVRLKSSSPKISDCEPDVCRVVFSDSEIIYLLEPVPASQAAVVPNIRALQRKAYDAIITGVQ
jgi:hypothetical protein